MELILIVAFVVTILGGSTGLPDIPPTWSPSQEFPPPPSPPLAPPSAPFPVCISFPGTAAWNKCWANFQARMSEFQKSMATFQEKMEAYRIQRDKWEKQFPGSGPINQLSTNGYTIRSRGVSVSTHTINSRMFLDAQIGHSDKLDVTYSDTTMRFDILNDGSVSKWLTITPPTASELKKIKYITEDDWLHIWIAGTVRSSNPNIRPFTPFNMFFGSTSSDYS